MPNGWRIIGTTLWSHVPLYAKHIVEENIQDYRQIYLPKSSSQSMRMWNMISVNDTNHWHDISVKYVDAQLKASAKSGDHTPLAKGVSNPAFEEIHPIHKLRDPINTAFATPLDTIFEKHFAPKAWAFGHTHWSCDFNFQKTRILSNSRGYVQGEWKCYKPDFVVEF